MGAGFHGGFGTAERYRKGKIVNITKTYEMALNPKQHAEMIAKKMNIHLKGSGKAITIVINPNLPPGIYGKTREENPYQIEIGPSAFYSEAELANTIAHELNHARSFIKGGRAPENTARKSGKTLEKYMKGLI